VDSRPTPLDPRYPIGKFQGPSTISRQQREQWIATIDEAPRQMREAVKGLSEQQLDTPYREGGWTVRQVVHHVPESHMNAYIRYKLALTEDTPTIKPYREDKWALLPDIHVTPVEISLQLLAALHVRWVNLMKVMPDQDWSRKFYHPEMGKYVDLQTALATYAWHGRHHIAHITTVRKNQGW
jgi:hypothetical protein